MSTATTMATTTTTRPLPTVAQLREWTLTVAELPPGWAAETDTGPTGGEPAAGDQDSGFLCASARSLSEDEGDSAEAQFSQTENGPFLFQSIAAADDADAQFAEAERLLAGCVGEEWQMDSDGELLAMTMASVSTPKVGDAVAAFRATGRATTAPVTLTMDFVLVRRGKILQMYGAMNVSSPVLPTPQLSGGDYASLVKAGDEKVAERLGRAVDA